MKYLTRSIITFFFHYHSALYNSILLITILQPPFLTFGVPILIFIIQEQRQSMEFDGTPFIFVAMVTAEPVAYLMI